MSRQAQRITIHYEGRVQGVCFRWTVMELVQSFDVTGFVRNCSDGRVELIVEGENEEIMGLINSIRLSHLSQGILNEQMIRSKATGKFDSFSIQY